MCVLGISSTLSKWDDQCNTLGEVDCLIEGAVSNGGPLALPCVVMVHHPKCRVPQIGEPTKGRGGGGDLCDHLQRKCNLDERDNHRSAQKYKENGYDLDLYLPTTFSYKGRRV